MLNLRPPFDGQNRTTLPSRKIEGYCMRLTLAALIVLAWFTPSLAFADAASGRKTAEARCANCHVVVGVARPPTGTPAFGKIARKSTDKEIRTFLSQPHGQITPPLTPAEIDDLVAFIGTLR